LGLGKALSDPNLTPARPSNRLALHAEPWLAHRSTSAGSIPAEGWS